MSMTRRPIFVTVVVVAGWWVPRVYIHRYIWSWRLYTYISVARPLHSQSHDTQYSTGDCGMDYVVLALGTTV